MTEDRVVGCLVGLAVGDAVGTSVEFEPRGSFPPVVDMTGGGPFDLDKGQWTDDTSMALCLANSLLQKREFDAYDQMIKYRAWYEAGYMSSNGQCFDIGANVFHAIKRFNDTEEPYSGSTKVEHSGNGSIMRLAPVVMFYRNDITDCVNAAVDSSRTTHGSQLCIDACSIFAKLVLLAFEAGTKDSIFDDNSLTQFDYSAEFSPLIDGSFKRLSYEEIRGSGYVVDCLIAAMWCFYHSDNFKDAILLAVNLGDDADTTAAVCGQIAGAYYGLSGIPEDWHNSLARHQEIKTIARQLYNAGKDKRVVTYVV